ncbi:hypothetical protein PSTT_11526 [Puccinia striiformis]|uniref:Uncharacterized protein n=1 Tax=Puccinia striiformis TaxID=27350 RepID=A0A2S4UZT1_9BASI|nr:hypothetical protein PSTT_11526 [Puccinia striiformis]
MSQHWTPFLESRDLKERRGEEIKTVISVSQSSYQRVYESLCIIGLVLTSVLLISHTFGKRGHKRHPIVIAFIAITMLSYWNALLPWLFNFWAAQKSPTLSEDNDEQNLPTHIACRINGVLTSYPEAYSHVVQTVIPSFAAAFVGEALRITWQVSKITRPKPPSPLPDSTLSTRQALVLAKPRMDPEKKASVHFEENSSSDFSNTVRKWEHVVFVETHSMSNRKDNSWEIVESPDTSTSPSHRNHSKGKFLSFNPGTEGKWPFVLCLVPTLCGLPQLVLILVSYLQVGKAWIFQAAASLGAMTLLFLLALTAVFSGLMLSILFRMRRSASKHGKSNLDMGLLIPIGFLSAHSIAGCLVVAVMYFTSKDKYHEALDLFGVINPIASALILTDWEIFTIWNRWIRGSISFIMACLGLNGLQITNTGLPATLSNHISTKYRQSSKSKRAADGSWSPPKPSYNRSHRLVSMSSVADSDIYERETPRPGSVSPASSSSRCRSLKNSSGRPRHSAPPERQRRSFRPADHPNRGKYPPDTPVVTRATRHATFVPENRAGSKSSKFQSFETVMLQMDSEKNQRQNLGGFAPCLECVANPHQRKRKADVLLLEVTTELKKYNRKPSKTL